MLTYIISATTPFIRDDLVELRNNAAAVLARRVPEFQQEYHRLGWKMFPTIDRVYDNKKAQQELNWTPRHNFVDVLERLRTDNLPLSKLAYEIGKKDYHDSKFEDGPYPV